MIDIDGVAQDARRLVESCGDEESLKQVKAGLLGKKGSIAALFKKLKEVPENEVAAAGKKINELKLYIEQLIGQQRTNIKEIIKKEKLSISALDITLPGYNYGAGSLHPIEMINREMIEIFNDMGFSVATGPEMETDELNFELLNIGKDHPARDMQDTFYIDSVKGLLLRTHTSPVQIRAMRQTEPPIAIIAPGIVYRRDSDVTHSPMFHQIEGLMIDRQISLADLKGVLTAFLHKVFGKRAVRFRPSYFPFTEPSAEVDVSCIICHGKGCRVCSHTGWLEILGSGMVHPNVIRNVGYDSDKWQGFAFGIGIERIAMLKYGIDDIRLFFNSDLRFLSQFSGILH
ncbi:MAG TPA: phenylalanine--tRNA ligase subunit alpha [Deltaproteobacteria bacterium]|nr:phenylalanine--tRNA ligase subunit alpha [Deltaproteobacteria bacterium]